MLNPSPTIKIVMSFGPGFPTRNFFDPVAIAWAFLAGGIFEAVRIMLLHKRTILSFFQRRSAIALIGGLALSATVVGLTVQLIVSKGFEFGFVALILVGIGGSATIIVQNHPRFNKPPAAP